MPVNYPVVGQAFNFNGLDISGDLVGWSGQTQRRGISHKFVRRAGAKVEDFNREQRWLEANIVFTTDYQAGNGAILVTAAQKFASFEQFIGDEPIGLLIHPIAGRWTAFCEGPQHSVEFARATDAMTVRVRWIESELNAQLATDIPDVATAAQNATASQAQANSNVANFMGFISKAKATTNQARNALDEALSNVDLVTAPIDLIRSTAAALFSAQSAIAGTIDSIFVRMQLLNQDITNFVTSSTDIFNGAQTGGGQSTAISTQLGILMQDAASVEDVLSDGSPTPAGSAEAIGAVNDAVADCITLYAAVRAAQPPIILFTNPSLTDLVTLCQRRYGKDAGDRADYILGINRIPNPSAIPSGFKMLIPAR